MEDDNSLKRDNINKPFRLKLIISAAVLLLIVITVFVFILIEQNKPDPASAAVIRAAASIQLGKDPNELTDEDFVGVTTLMLSSKELRDIKLIEKFTNLEVLHFYGVQLLEAPKWMKILSKFGLVDIEKRYALDIGPIKKLDNLKMLLFSETQVSSYEPLSEVKSLESISILFTNIHDFESLKKLKNIKSLSFMENKNITQKDIDELKKALPETKVSRFYMY